MNPIRYLNLLAITCILLIFNNCVPESDDTEKTTLMVNQWVSDVMHNYYFWYEHIPDGKKPDGTTNPEDYFNSLLYTAEDRFSFITDDYSGFISELEGSPLSMGYSPAFGRFTGTDNVFIIVKYVYPNSPAAKAGLKRGDIIIKIDNEMLTTDDYYDKFSGGSYTVTLGEYSSQGISESFTKISLKAEVLDINPVICEKIFELNNKKTGYVAIGEFTDFSHFKEKVKPTFDRFAAAGINNLIVDLRYNGGGEQNAAIWLASVIAPSVTIAQPELIIKVTYNDKLQSLMVNEHKTEFTFNDSPGVNLNLSNVYFITSRFTASASELVIVGLEPYMNVIQVGENTVGKYTGMWVIPDLVEPARHNWGILPIVMKYANAQGKTDFKDGLVPDYYVEDQLFNAYPLDNLNDPQTYTAVSLASGLKTGVAQIEKPANVELIMNKKEAIKQNLILMH